MQETKLKLKRFPAKKKNSNGTCRPSRAISEFTDVLLGLVCYQDMTDYGYAYGELAIGHRVSTRYCY